MKHMFSFCCAMTLAAAALTPLTAAAKDMAPETVTAGDLLLTAQGNAWLITGCMDKTVTNITIPAAWDGKPVLIEGNPFSDCPALTKILAEPGGAYTSADGVLFRGDVLVVYPCARAETSYTLPADTRVIGKYAFQNCIALETVTLNETLHQADSGCFTGCTALQEISGFLPAETGDVVDGCESLTALRLKAPNSTFRKLILQELPQLRVLELAPDSLLSDGISIQHCPLLETLHVTNAYGQTILPEILLEDCAALTEVTLPAYPSNSAGGYGLIVIDCPSLKNVRVNGEGAVPQVYVKSAPALEQLLFECTLQPTRPLADWTLTECDALTVCASAEHTALIDLCARLSIPFAPLDPLPSEDEAACPGDVEPDGVLNVKDAVLLARLAANDRSVVIAPQGLVNADLNGDGVPTADDLMILLKALAKKA